MGRREENHMKVAVASFLFSVALFAGVAYVAIKLLAGLTVGFRLN